MIFLKKTLFQLNETAQVVGVSQGEGYAEGENFAGTSTETGARKSTKDGGSDPVTEEI